MPVPGLNMDYSINTIILATGVDQYSEFSVYAEISKSEIRTTHIRSKFDSSINLPLILHQLLSSAIFNSPDLN